MLRKLIIGLVWGTSALAAGPPTLAETPTDVVRNMSQACFPSGLSVLFRVDQRQPVVAVTAVVDGGARQDPVGKEGVAHVAEHAWFRAVHPGASASVQARLRALGASWNAVTMADATVFLTEAPADGLEELLRLEGQRLTTPLAGVDAALFAGERQLVSHEATLKGELYTDDLPRLVPGLYANAAGQHFDPETSGSALRVTQDDVKAAVASWKPWNTTLVITGDFDPSVVVARMQALLPKDVLFRDRSGRYPAEGVCASRVRQLAATPAPERGVGRPPVVQFPLAQPHLMYGWPLGPGFGAEDPLRALMAKRMSWMLAGIKVATGDDAAAGCRYLPGPERSSVVCWVPVLPGVSPDAVDRKARAALALAPGNPADLTMREVVAVQGAMGRLETVWSLGELSGLSGMGGLHDALVTHYAGVATWYLDAIPAWSRVSPDDLAALGKTWLRPAAALTSLVVAPGTDVAALYARQGDASVSGGSSSAGMAGIAAHHDVSGAGETPATPPVKPRLAAPVSGRLPTGLEIVVVPHGEGGVVRVGLHVPAGPAWDTTPGLDEWTSFRTGVAVDRFPVRGRVFHSMFSSALQAGGRRWSSYDTDEAAFGLFGGAADLEELLWLMRTRLDAQGITEVSPDAEQDFQRAVAAEGKQPWAQAWAWQAGQLIGPTHPLASTMAQRVAGASKAGMSQLLKQLQRTWRPDRARLVIVGDVDAAWAHQLAAFMFQGWSGAGPTPDWSRKPASPAVTGLVTKHFADADRATTRVSLACLATVRSEAARQVAAHVLQKAAWRALRESELAAYDPRASIVDLGPAWMVQVTASVRPEDRDRATERLGAVARWAGERGPNDATVADSARWVARHAALQAVDVDQVYLLTARHGDRVQDVVRGLPGAALAVTAADVKATLAPCAEAAVVTSVGR